MKWGLFIAVASLSATSTVARPAKIERNSSELEFSYEWPREAVAIPALDHRFRTEAAMAYRRHLTIAQGEQKIAREQKRDYNSQFYSKAWASVGQTPRLLSLEYQLGTFTGGAHPNTSYGALLWDRKLNKEIGFTSTFLRADTFARLTRGAYCAALDKERLKRREGERLEGEFSKCPQYSEIAIASIDKNKNGRFDTIKFVASPYVAGPYVEGEYEISLPVASQLIAAIRPEYRNSFERQRQ